MYLNLEQFENIYLYTSTEQCTLPPPPQPNTLTTHHKPNIALRVKDKKNNEPRHRKHCKKIELICPVHTHSKLTSKHSTGDGVHTHKHTHTHTQARAHMHTHTQAHAHTQKCIDHPHTLTMVPGCLTEHNKVHDIVLHL